MNSSVAVGFMGFVMGAVLVFSAFSSAGIGPGFLSFVLWLLFGHFWGLPPLIGLLATWELWRPNEALAGLVIQVLLFVGALWAFEAAGIGDLMILFVVFSAINGVLMAPAMMQEKRDEAKKLQADDSD